MIEQRLEMTVIGAKLVAANMTAQISAIQRQREQLQGERDALALQVAILTNERDDARAGGAR